MHHKDVAIGPALRATAGLTVTTVAGLDTDQLGTFTGEIERVGTMLDAAVRKARLGMVAKRASLGLASEGSFGPHPGAPFIPAGLELLVLVDDASGVVIHEDLWELDTNHAHSVVAPDADVRAFLERVGFPSHALIVRPNVGEAGAITAKGVVDIAALSRSIAQAAAQSSDGRARLETDMRADRNPTRMRSLAVLAERLGRRLATPCPVCAAPGWGRTDVIVGLPCAWCGLPTDLIVAEIFSCPAAPHPEQRPREDGLTSADPGNCPNCNP
ncbi:MAG: hypothetical protein LH650_05565 [Chloroflexi bacterium]|nr:hypothetical protein [Chloroflexota bacterium]